MSEEVENWRWNSITAERKRSSQGEQHYGKWNLQMDRLVCETLAPEVEAPSGATASALPSFLDVLVIHTVFIYIYMYTHAMKNMCLHIYIYMYICAHILHICICMIRRSRLLAPVPQQSQSSTSPT